MNKEILEKIVLELVDENGRQDARIKQLEDLVVHLGNALINVQSTIKGNNHA